jgi:hypothetical protein
MSWQQKTISPKLDKPPKMNIRYPSPGLCRFAGLTGFLAVGLGVYYGGTRLLGLEPLNMASPAWTVKHVVLVGAGILLGMLGSLLAFAFTMTIQVRNARLNDLYIILWQFLANGSLVWFMIIGVAMSISLGRQEAKDAVLHFGAERAIVHVIGTGVAVGLLLGAAFFLARVFRLPFIPYLAFAVTVALLAARWHFFTYGIEGKSWILAGLVVPILLLMTATPMIERDRRQRRLVMEQSSE